MKYNFKHSLPCFYFLILLTLLACTNKQIKQNKQNEKVQDLQNEIPINANWEQIDSTPGVLAGKTIIFQGHLSFPLDFVDSNVVCLYAYERYNQCLGARLYITIPIKNGNGAANRKGNNKSFIIKDDNGNELTEYDKIEFTVKMNGSGTHVLKVINFKKVDSLYTDYSKYKTLKLTESTYVDSTIVEEKLIMTEGVFIFPTIVFDDQYNRNCQLIELKISKLLSITGCISVGAGKSRMDYLPYGFTKDDFVIRDKNGRTLRAGEKVRVYGIGSYKTIDGKLTGSIYVESIEKI